METVTATIERALPALSSSALMPPPVIYARDGDSAERGLVIPLQDMPPLPEGGLRQRQGLSTSNNTEQGTDAESPEILTPSSSSATEEAEGKTDYKRLNVRFADECKRSNTTAAYAELMGSYSRQRAKMPP